MKVEYWCLQLLLLKCLSPFDSAKFLFHVSRDSFVLWMRMLVTQLFLTPCNPMDSITGVDGHSFPSSGDFPNPGIETWSLAGRFFFFFFFISWRLITLQYFSGFCHTLKWIRFLPGEFHGQRSLAGYSPWDREESGMAECLTLFLMGFPGGSSGKKKKKKSACSAGDLGSIRGSGRCPGEGMATHSTSFFENSKDKGTWWQVHGFAKSQIPLSNCYWICYYNCHIFWINWYFVSFKNILLGWY